MGGPVEGLADDLLGGRDRQISELPPELSDGVVALELDLVARPLEERFRLGLGLATTFFLEALRNLLRLGNNVLPFAASTVDLILGLAIGLGLGLAAPLGRLQPLPDPFGPGVEHI